MDTPKNKKKVRKRSSNNKENKQNIKKQKTAKRKSASTIASIAMSTQLALKKKTVQVGKPRYSKQAKVCLDSESGINKVCVNGKQMPALADLEAMFEDSDGDEQPSPKPVHKPPNTPTKETTKESEKKILSPTTVKRIADRMMDMISDVSHPSEIFDIRPPSPDIPPPPVIPPKKIKKPDTPYIVGCKDRPRVEKRPTTSFCKGGDDYGVSENSETENEPPKKRAKKSKIKPYSKSIFNSKSKEIAMMLKENESAHDGSCNINETINEDYQSNESSDSNKTVDYNFDSYTNTITLFTPIPSTSKNNEIFIENDNLFNKSLAVNMTVKTPPEEDIEDKDIEIIEVPCETIVVNDVTNNDISVIEERDISCFEVTECIESKLTTKFPKFCLEADDDCILVKDDETMTGKNNPITANILDTTTIVIDDDYANIDIDNSFQSDDVEIIDVDSLIEESRLIIDKIQKSKQSESIIEVVEVYNNTRQQTDSVNNSVNNGNVSAVNVETYVPNKTTSDNERIRNNNTRSSASPYNPVSFVIAQVVADFFENHYRNNPKNMPLDPNKPLELLPSNFNLNNRETVQSTLQGCTTNISSSYHPRNESTLTRPVNPDPHFGILLPSSTPLPPKPKRKRKDTPTYSTPCELPADHSPPISNTKNIGECPICMESLSNNAIASTICGHVFCLKCIQAAVKSSGKKCPTCRKALKGAGFHQLYL